tara:strand:- start:8235 stop:8609 length:375 start_codon:yes stop_codon:yes gene_type:complete
MKEKTSVMYSFTVNDDDTKMNEIEYKKYSKYADNDEKLLTYKKSTKSDKLSGDVINNESFNELHKKENNINEVIGHSYNKTDWNIIESGSNVIEKKYIKEYDNLKLDINYDIINKCKTKYLNDN